MCIRDRAGGMNEMLYSISIIVIAMGFGGIMQHTKQIETLLTPLINRIKSKGSLGLVTVLSCVCLLYTSIMFFIEVNA